MTRAGPDLRQVLDQLSFQTHGQGLHEITRDVTRWLDAQGVANGLLTIFSRHTSASLLIQENAAPAVQRDLQRWMADLAPESARYEHDDEGADDMPAHLRTAVTNVQLAIPVMGGRMTLGTWQGIYLWEHRHRPHGRTPALHLLGA